MSEANPYEIPTLELDSVHVWILRIPEDLETRTVFPESKDALVIERRILNAEEQKRADAFRFESDEARFTWCRSALRRLIGGYLKIDPSEARLDEGPFGKPWLSRPDRALRFNISHTPGLGVISISRTIETGIDVESSVRSIRDRELIPRCFTEREQRQIEADESTWQDMFFRFWTAKESLMKATGLGLSIDPRKIEVTLPVSAETSGAFSTSSDRVTATDWILHELPDAPPYRIALATPPSVVKENIEVRSANWPLAT